MEEMINFPVTCSAEIDHFIEEMYVLLAEESMHLFLHWLEFDWFKLVTFFSWFFLLFPFF